MKIQILESIPTLQLDEQVNYVIQITDTVPTSGLTIPAALTAKARAYRNAAYTPGGVGFAKVPLDAETYDPGENFDSTVNNRFTAPITGYYAVSGAVAISGAMAGDVFMVALYVNGGESSRGNQITVGATAGHSLVVNDIIYMVAGSYIELWVSCSTARTFGVGSMMTYMSVHLIGR